MKIKPKKEILPRDAATSFKLPSTKPGAIKAMCSLPGFLEMYTPHETFRTRSPESIDPERTNPSAMWETLKIHDIGAASPFVAQTMIMASDMLRNNLLFEGTQRDQLLLNMHRLKERLLQCVKADSVYQDALTVEEAAIAEHGLQLTANARAYERFPQVPDIEDKVTSFLIASRRTITEICQIPGHFFGLARPHSALEHLINTDLIKILGPDHRLIKYFQTRIGGTKRIIDMRNGQEHVATTKAPKLNIRNYEMLPTNQIMRPVWYLDSEEPADIAAEMQAIPTFLLTLAETMFLACIDAILPHERWPALCLEMFESVDPERPVRYGLSFDPGKLKFPDID